MTDEELIARLRERGGRIPNLAADRIAALNKELAIAKDQRTRIRNTVINLLLSADSGDEEVLAWAIQLVRDDVASEGNDDGR